MFNELTVPRELFERSLLHLDAVPDLQDYVKEILNNNPANELIIPTNLLERILWEINNPELTDWISRILNGANTL